MSKRTNTAVWEEKYQRWRIAVQKDGVRKQFYSSTPGRTGQREANAKADRWLDDGIAVKASRVEDAGKLWLASVELTTSHTNYRPIESRWRIWVLPVIGKKRVTALTDQDLQNVIDHAYAAGLSRKTLQSISGDMNAFCKFCRKSKIATFRPELESGSFLYSEIFTELCNRKEPLCLIFFLPRSLRHSVSRIFCWAF